MDDFVFDEFLTQCTPNPEASKWLEILHYKNSGTSPSDTSPNVLHEHKIRDFIYRKGVFAKHGLVDVTSGIRLLIQDNLKRPEAFHPTSISLTADNYESLVRKMHLPLQIAESSSVVGPFFWSAATETLPDPSTITSSKGHMQLIFRKSDVKWEGASRGWDMVLSHSFDTKLTSGYIRGTESAKIGMTVKRLVSCSKGAAHPFLLPMLVLTNELSSNETDQREIRDELRKLESAVSGRYNTNSAERNEQETSVKLDSSITRDLADLQCRVMWRRPQAWQNAVRRLSDAMTTFWDMLPPEDQTSELRCLHKSILSRLDFTTARLDGLESYTQVSLGRLNIQREVMNSFISQRESRLSLDIAVQQRRLAHDTRRDSTSMKTLTLMGAMFLPGAFLSSMFSMSFFNFGNDLDGSVSPRLWIYFATFIPLTMLVLGIWWMLDKHDVKKRDAEETEAEMNKLESRIMEGIRRKTGARVQSELHTHGHQGSGISATRGWGMFSADGAGSGKQHSIVADIEMDRCGWRGVRSDSRGRGVVFRLWESGGQGRGGSGQEGEEDFGAHLWLGFRAGLLEVVVKVD
ncbi:hypothetical protein OQA88_2980 [Cercophora sp. LCS_1]